MNASKTAWIIQAAACGDAGAPELALPDFEAAGKEILDQARLQAQQIVAAAQAQLESAQTNYNRSAYEQGFQRGQTEGYAHGLRQAAQKSQLRMSALAQAAGKIVDELAAAAGQVQQDRQEQLLRFGIELARRIVGEVAAVDTRAALVNLRRAMELASDADEIIVCVNPGQLPALEQEGQRLWRQLARAGRVRFEADSSIAAGGARVLTRCGAVDATIETQLRRVAQALLGRPSEPQQNTTGRYIPAADTSVHADI
ncbi:MAG: FliH/SctL family protein [Phycisphaerae bacterium]